MRTGRVSVVIRRLIHYSWHEPAGERPRWAGTKVQLDRDQLFARDRHSTEKDFPMSISITHYLGRMDSNKQCFHHHFMHTCLLRATVWRAFNRSASRNVIAVLRPPKGSPVLMIEEG